MPPRWEEEKSALPEEKSSLPGLADLPVLDEEKSSLPELAALPVLEQQGFLHFCGAFTGFLPTFLACAVAGTSLYRLYRLLTPWR